MKRLQRLIHNSKGEVMLEAAIIFPIVFVLVFSLISMGFLYYQKIMVQIVANETAAYIAAGYKITESSLQDDVISSASELGDLQMYRSSFFVKKMAGEHQDRANTYLSYRMSYGNLGMNRSVPEAEVTVTVDNVGRMHVTCVVTQQCDVFLGGVLKMAGITESERITFTGTGRAEVLDITAYGGYVHFLNYLNTAANNSFGPETAVGKLVSNVDKIIKAFE